MKRLKVFFTFTIMIAASNLCLAQEKPVAELFDKFGAVSCSEIRGRLDSFMVALRNELNAVGYIIFYNGANELQSSSRKRTLRDQINARRFPPARIVFIDAKPENELKTEFWIGRNGEKPPVEESKANLVLDPKNRYLFAQNPIEFDDADNTLNYFHESECVIEGIDYDMLANYLNANPEMNAEVFVFNKSKKHASQVIKLFTNEATNKYKISPSRLKISSAADSKEISALPPKISTVKIWLVPEGEKK